MKRKREQARQEKRREKAAQRQARNSQSRDRGEDQPESGEDPDLAGIVPGPQPVPWDEHEGDLVIDDDSAGSPPPDL